ncbi:hypothetical protein [Shigella phage ESh22]|nr:hypothetical protein [Shigella phage ESh22]
MCVTLCKLPQNKTCKILVSRLLRRPLWVSALT